MNPSTSIQPLLSAAILTGFAAVIIFMGIVLLCLNWWASLPGWLLKAEFILAQFVLLALFASLIRLRMAGNIYVRTHVVAVVLLLGGMVAFSGVVGFPGSKQVRYLCTLSSAAAPLMLLLFHGME